VNSSFSYIDANEEKKSLKTIEVCRNHVSFNTGGTSRGNEGQLLCLLLMRERAMSVISCKENPIEMTGSDLQGNGSD
jgi:hypothetical protein